MVKSPIDEMKAEKALRLYEKGEISIARAAELVDGSLSEMMTQAVARGLKPLFDKKMVEEDMQEP